MTDGGPTIIVVPGWRIRHLNERELAQLSHARYYHDNCAAANSPGHGHLMLIAKLAGILDGCPGSGPPTDRADAVRYILNAVCPVLGIKIDKMLLDAGLHSDCSTSWYYRWEMAAWIGGERSHASGTVSIQSSETGAAAKVARHIINRIAG